MFRKPIFITFILLASAALVAFVPPLVTLLALLGVLALVFLARNLEFGLIILVFFFPYLGLVIDFGAFRAFREVYYLRNINAPFIDLYGLLLLGAWGVNVVARHFMCRQSGGQAPALRLTLKGLHFKSYFLFWLSGLASLLTVSSRFFGSSVKYFFRPFSFFYPVFFAVPVSIMARAHNPSQPPLTLRGGEIGLLHRVLMVFYATGLLSAFNGLLGLLFSAYSEFPRATPFGFFGVNPLGPNHNLLAETLIATAPAGLVLMQNEKLKIKNDQSGKRNFTFYILHVTFFMWAIALLTFARTAWIAIGLQAIIYFWCTYRGRVAATFRSPLWRFKNRRYIVPILLLASCFLLLLIGTTLTETVRGSTLSRLDQSRIAVFYFLRSPALGQGIGTFIPTLWETRAFLLEYGDPLEAHGIALKLAFEQGLAGLIAFGIFVGSIFVSLIKAYRKTARVEIIAALMIAAGSVAYQLFNTTYYSSKLWVPLAIAVAIGQLSKLSKSGELSKASV
ncbi:MAG: hypothetical protein Q7S48_01760 [bacterium]|nr:hypothetical protein [bacterium]